MSSSGLIETGADGSNSSLLDFLMNGVAVAVVQNFFSSNRAVVLRRFFVLV